MGKQYEINNDIFETKYFYNENHKLISFNNSISKMNIGDNGENLTISILSLNRASLTLRLMKSITDKIPYFAGEFLIIDNYSAKEEKEKIRSEFDNFNYKCRMIELEKNYGVAGGRNKAMEYVNTDWVMFLDNDIYFIENPLKDIQKQILTLGCHFLNLPLLDSNENKVFALGGQLYLYCNDGEILVGGGSVYKQRDIIKDEKVQAFLSTFLFGGASVINKETFLKLGGFDDGMFIGFEDTDFSIRLFQSGYKIGNSTELCLVHDHQKPEHKTDADYERERFSEAILKKSAEYFENKHNIRIWTENTSTWLKEKQNELGIGNNNDKTENNSESSNQNNNINNINISLKTKPKISLVTDTDNWAFANISRQLKRYLSEYYDIKIIPMSMLEDIGKVLLISRESDLIHFFWRTHTALINHKEIRAYTSKLNINYERFYEKYAVKLNLSTCVYDHLFLENENISLNKQIFELAPNYYVSSNKLKTIYDGLDYIPKPKCVLEDGVDLTLFKPLNLQRFDNIIDREVVIGWSGNSQWANDIEDFKGVNTILKPALKELIEEGYKIKPYFADRAERMIPHRDMVNYYSKIDVYICTSKIEGTPNPVLESMACGVPVISTDVGIVPDAFGEKQRRFILKERTKECLKNTIKQLLNNRELFLELSNENQKSILTWDWCRKTLGFKEFFQSSIDRQV